VLESGESTVLLAMRYTLAEQVGVTVPEATDQRSFRDLGIRYGVFADAEIVRDRLSDGTRLSVADAAASANILAYVEEDPADDQSTDAKGAK
jgi:hypothetical protein